MWLALCYSMCGCGSVEVIGVFSSEDLANAAIDRFVASHNGELWQAHVRRDCHVLEYTIDEYCP